MKLLTIKAAGLIALLTGSGCSYLPESYALYALTLHGFFLGLLAFLFGFCFIFSGDKFWQNPKLFEPGCLSNLHLQDVSLSLKSSNE